MSYNSDLNMQGSWCNMHDDFDDFDDFKDIHQKKEIFEISNFSNNSNNSDNSHNSNNSSNSNNSTNINKKPSNLNSNDQLSLEEILTLDYSKNIDELELLKYQIYVIGQLKKYLVSCVNNSSDFDIDSHLPKLEWLSSSILFLAKKRSQKDIKFRKKTDHIQRNSYEFCNLGSKCVNNNICNKKHIVYNYVHCDICELIRYLIQKKNITIKEIFTSINTINYVINHMYDEIVSHN